MLTACACITETRAILAAMPIILIHGTAASLHTWEPLVERLGEKYRINFLYAAGAMA